MEEVFNKQLTFEVNNQNVTRGLAIYDQILEETKTPVEISTKFLMDLLKDNKDTEYGKKYDFANISSIEEYQKKVPIINYEDVKDDLERMLNGEKDVLTAYPFDHMNETSGTSGDTKIVPMTSKQTQINMKYNNAIVYGVMGKTLDPKWMNGRSLSTTEGSYVRMPSGITRGGASSKMAEYLKGGVEELNSLLGTMYTSPVEATMADNGADRIYLQARFALMDKEMTGIFSGFFNQVIHILNYIILHYEVLIDDIEKGTINEKIKMPEKVRQTVEARLKPMPERAKELKEIFKDGPHTQFGKKVWPNITYFYGVGGASFSVYDDMLTRQFFGEGVDRIYSGIAASEGIWSFPITKNSKASCLATGSAFMEFLPVEANNDFSQIKTIDQLEIGKTYELIITNVNGLYRYRMSDAVTVVDYLNKTPLVEFAYRVNNTINLAGEKTTEIALEEAVDKAMKELNVEYFDFCIIPDTEHGDPRYVFLVEPIMEHSEINDEKLADALIKGICKAHRGFEHIYLEAGLLGKPIAHFLQPQTFNLYRDIMIMKGVSASQLKPVKVAKTEQQRKFFMVLRRV